MSAQGFLELGDPEYALFELKPLFHGEKTHPVVLWMRAKILRAYPPAEAGKILQDACALSGSRPCAANHSG